VQELRHLRKARGLSQPELAAATGVDQATISLIETGRRKPQLETLEKLAPALGVDVRDFFPRSSPTLPLFEPQPAERVSLANVTSVRQRATLEAELRRLYREWESGELPTDEYSSAVVNAINGTLDAAQMAAKEAG